MFTYIEDDAFTRDMLDFGPVGKSSLVPEEGTRGCHVMPVPTSVLHSA